MKRQIKLSAQQQIEEQQQRTVGQNLEKEGVLEFATPEELLRHDALHTPVPPNVAHRVRDSIAQIPPTSRPWWRRLLGLS